jgi:IAA-amino acid hydrolase
VLAAAGSFDFKVHGKGGHAAAPHQTADPIVAAAAIVQALQPIVARRLDPLDAGVVSVTYIHAGATNNVIPAEVAVGGTYRALSHKTFGWLREQVRLVHVLDDGRAGPRREIGAHGV